MLSGRRCSWDFRVRARKICGAHGFRGAPAVRTSRRVSLFGRGGTPSAEMADDVPEEVKQARVERIMELQRNISHEANVARIGRKLRVVVDRREGDYYVARSEYDSPEVDQEILIPVAEGRLLPGEFREVVVTACEEYDLYGRLA